MAENYWRINASNSRLFFLKAGGSLFNIRLRFKKNRRDVTFPGLGLQFLWLLLELIYNIFLIPKPAWH